MDQNTRDHIQYLLFFQTKVLIRLFRVLKTHFTDNLYSLIDLINLSVYLFCLESFFLLGIGDKEKIFSVVP
jgi:hypothetical protein